MRFYDYITEASKPELKDGEYAVRMPGKQKVKALNPKSNRMKNFKRDKWIKTTVPPEERSFKNMPKYSDGKPRARFQDWLGIPRNGGKGSDGKYYGWSHRAVNGFGVGDTIKKGHIGNKHDVGLEWDEKGKDFEPYTIETEKEAEEHAIRFMKEVS